MASKGQIFAKHSPELKEQILKEYFEGKAGPKSLGKKYGVPLKTIETWIRKTKLNIDVRIDHRPGHSGRYERRNNLTIEDYKERYEILKKYQAFLQAQREKK